MGRIVAQVVVENLSDPDKSIAFDALVDTDASHLTLPLAWKDRLGDFPMDNDETLMLADQSELEGNICGPAKIQVEGFRAVANEIMFLDMKPVEGDKYEPLIGYIVLEQCQAAVDMLGHRLVKVRALDSK